MIALDTNILAYAASVDDAQNRHISALTVLQKLGPIGAIVPLPVFGEFFNACLRKKLAQTEQVASCVQLWMDAFDCPSAIAEDYLMASAISDRFQMQYFDALITTVARRAGATVLFSEDMQDGQIIDGLKIVNPFAPANEILLADYFANAL